MLVDIYKNKKNLFADSCSTVFRVQEDELSRVDIMDGNIISNKTERTTGLNARVFKNGVYGFASMSDITGEAAEQAIKKATDYANILANRTSNDAKLTKVESGIVLPQTIADSIENKYMVEKCKELYDYIKSNYDNLKSIKVLILQQRRKTIIYTSDAANGESNRIRSGIGIAMVSEDNDNNPIEVFFPFAEAVGIKELFNNINSLYEKIDEKYKALMDKKNAVYAEAGIKQVILGSDVSGMIAHEAVGHTVEADLVKGGSVAKDQLGQKVASSKISIVDFAHTAFGKMAPVPIHIDDEGVIAKDSVIIDNGILTNYLLDREHAEYFGLEACGNSRACDYGDEPLIRMRNTAVLPGNDKLEDMIESIDDGYYFIDTVNGQADLTGEFMFATNLGYEIKNGKLGHPIKSTTLSGIAFDVLQSADMVSGNFAWTHGSCGKGQWVKVGTGGPDVRCKINVGGR